jgi:DNA repair protein RecO (recombination protein O)
LSLLKKRGIILQSNTYSEADALITLLSDDGFKEKFLIKGIKKSKKRPIVASEIGTLIQIDYYFHQNNSTFFLVKEISLEKRYDIIKNNYISTLILCLFLELIEKTLPEGYADPKHFKLLYSALEALEIFGSKILILPFFKFKLLLSLGVVPREYNCQKCGEGILTKDTAKINLVTLEAICGDCEIFSENDIEIIRLFKGISKKSYDLVVTETIPEVLLMRADTILDKFIISSLGISPKSSEMLYRSLHEINAII